MLQKCGKMQERRNLGHKQWRTLKDGVLAAHCRNGGRGHMGPLGHFDTEITEHKEQQMLQDSLFVQWQGQYFQKQLAGAENGIVEYEKMDSRCSSKNEAH